MSPTAEDRRTAERVVFPCDARCYGVGEALIDAHLVDLSLSGAFLETGAEMPVGSILLLRFNAGGERVKIEAEVVHRVDGRGLGIRFINMGPGERGTIARITSGSQG